MDEKGFTPLMTAAVYNAMESLDCLIEYDPDLDLQNPSGKTALMLACQSG
jgi:ankyrin repeat protein